MNSEILIYQNQEGNIKIDVCLEDETVWLKQAQKGQLFGKDKRTISEHISNVFSEGELDKSSTVRKFRTVQIEGIREVERELDYYNLDVIISVGYRVKSIQGTRFRQWATSRLREYIVKGFTMDDEHLKNLGGGSGIFRFGRTKCHRKTENANGRLRSGIGYHPFIYRTKSA